MRHGDAVAMAADVEEAAALMLALRRGAARGAAEVAAPVTKAAQEFAMMAAELATVLRGSGSTIAGGLQCSLVNSARTLDAAAAYLRHPGAAAAVVEAARVWMQTKKEDEADADGPKTAGVTTQTQEEEAVPLRVQEDPYGPYDGDVVAQTDMAKKRKATEEAKEAECGKRHMRARLEESTARWRWAQGEIEKGSLRPSPAVEAMSAALTPVMGGGGGGVGSKRKWPPDVPQDDPSRPSVYV